MSANSPVCPNKSVEDDSNTGHVVLGDELAWIRKRREAVFREYDHPNSIPPPPDRPPGQPPAAGEGFRTQCVTEGPILRPESSPDPRAERIRPGGGIEAPGPLEDHPDADGLLISAQLEAMDMNLAGLSFSGGGIRAGTFAIGFLQGLSSLRLLSRFDYLSTVSGGGYAGGWLAAWLFREGQASGLDHPLRNVEMQLAVSRVTQSRARRRFLNDLGGDDGHAHESLVVDEEPEPVRHLREYSSYLAPRLGLLTADTWAILMTWTRNVAINMMMLFPAAMLLVLAARGVVYAYANVNLDLINSGSSHSWFRMAAVMALLAGLVSLARGFWSNACALQEFRGPEPTAEYGTTFRRPGWEPRIFSSVIRPILIAALLVTSTILPLLNDLGGGVQALAMGGASSSSWASARIWLGEHLQFLSLPNILLHVVVFGLMMMIGSLLTGKSDRASRRKFLSAAFAAGASGGVLFGVAEYFLADWGGHGARTCSPRSPSRSSCWCWWPRASSRWRCWDDRWRKPSANGGRGSAAGSASRRSPGW